MRYRQNHQRVFMRWITGAIKEITNESTTTKTDPRTLRSTILGDTMEAPKLCRSSIITITRAIRMVNISKELKIGRENRALIGDALLRVTTGRIDPRCNGNSQRIRPISVPQAHKGHPRPLPKVAEEAAMASNLMDAPTIINLAMESGETLIHQKRLRRPPRSFKVSRRCHQSPLR